MSRIRLEKLGELWKVVNPLRAGQNRPVALRDHLSACQYEPFLTPVPIDQNAHMISDKMKKMLNKAIIFLTYSREVLYELHALQMCSTKHLDRCMPLSPDLHTQRVSER